MLEEVLAYVPAAISSIVGVVAAVLTIGDYLTSLRLKRAKLSALPIRIRRPITYRQLLAAVRLSQEVLDELRFSPDVVIGIHYNGLAFGSLLAKQLYCPIHHASIHYGTDTGKHIPDSALISVELEALSGKCVLLVDNSMNTGNTLEFVRGLLEPSGAVIRTLVFYRKGVQVGAPRQPDIVLFYSKKELENFVR